MKVMTVSKSLGLNRLAALALFPALLITTGGEFAFGSAQKDKPSAAIAKKQAKKKAKGLAHNTKGPKSGGKTLKREFVFDGSTVNGQYHAAGEAVAKVEQEKKMNDLVGMRRDFKDRLGAEKERLQRGDEP